MSVRERAELAATSDRRPASGSAHDNRTPECPGEPPPTHDAHGPFLSNLLKGNGSGADLGRNMNIGVGEHIAHNKLAAGVGGHLALEFANTASWHLSKHPAERLRSWDDVVRWAAELQLISADQVEDLSAARGNLQRLISLREDIFSIALAHARDEQPKRAVVDRVSVTAQKHGPSPLPVERRLVWNFDIALADRQIAALLAREALSLCCSPRAQQIGLCEGEDCGWLFIDDSRSGRRRWCSMTDCGARAKAKRHYRRAKLPNPT
jgi:predicted RNA-binding Zn ribbon-like protein